MSRVDRRHSLLRVLDDVIAPLSLLLAPLSTMQFHSRLVERYIITAIFPYFMLALLLLTAALLAQQAGRFAEILGAARAPLGLTAEIMLGLLPNVLVFTLPMAMLVGTATGFSRLNSDSELVAMHAAGVGKWRITIPVLLAGGLLTIGTLYIGLGMTPEATRMLRQAALRATLHKLESPVEPRTFNTEMPNRVVYVRDGDEVRGQWGRVFINWREPDGATRLITARSGRIDVSGERSELVLSDAVSTTLPSDDPGPAKKSTQVVTERSVQARIRFPTGRGTLVERLTQREPGLDEVNWSELISRARTARGTERRIVIVALHRKLALCCAPLVCGLLGVSLGLRARRGGRGLGVLLSLLAMIIYYLALLAGEQLGRTGAVPPEIGAWLATGLALAAGLLLLIYGGRGTFRIPRARLRKGGRAASGARDRRDRIRGLLLTGLLDTSVFRALGSSFATAFMALIAIFLIFTLFELLRFITVTGASAGLVARYLLFLTPLAGVALAPMSVLVAVLATYALMARRSEAIAWWACGQSVYRLALPGAVFAALIGGGAWMIQERLMPEANRRQEALRAQIRGGVARAVTPIGRQWLATDSALRLYSYEYDERAQELRLPVVYEFDTEGVHLRRIIAGRKGIFPGDGTLQIEQTKVVEMTSGKPGDIQLKTQERMTDVGGVEQFKPVLNSPAELSSNQLSRYIKVLKMRGDGTLVAPLAVALERKRAAPLAPVVMALIGVPLALAFGRRSAMAALSAAIFVGLTFWGASSGFQQLGAYGLLPAAVAAWSPPVIFAAIGVYLLSRART